MIKLGIHRIGVQASALCAGLVWACSSGAMEAEPTHLREFAAYQAAFAKGDLSATIEHARTAWQAAELELGDSATTAILAYNYARSSFAYADARDSAAAAYRRTLALSESGISDFRIADLQIGLLELNLQGQGQEEAALQLETLLWERRRERLPPTDLSAHAWKSLATEQLRQLDLASAARHAGIAADEARALSPQDPELLSETQLINAVALLSDKHCVDNPEQIDQAIEHLEQVIALVSSFPDHPTMAERNRTASRWLASAQQLAERVRRSRSHVNAKYWPRR